MEERVVWVVAGLVGIGDEEAALVWQANGLIDFVADRKDDGIAWEFIILLQSYRHGILAFRIEFIVLHLEPTHPVVAVDKDAFRRSKKLKAHLRITNFRFAFLEFVREGLQDLIGLLANRCQAILDSSDLFLDALDVHVGADRSDFFGIILPFDWPASHDRRDSFDFL